MDCVSHLLQYQCEKKCYSTRLLQNENVCVVLSNMRLSDIFQRLILQSAQRLAPEASCGRRRSLSDHEALEHIFSVLRTGMQWRELPSRVHCTTVLRRFHRWREQGVFQEAYTQVLATYRKLSPSTRYCVDSTYVKNRYGRTGVGKNHTDRGRKALKLSVLTDGQGVVVGACCHPGNRPDVVLLEDTLQSAFTQLDQVELFADRGYDSRHNRQICRDAGLRDRIFRRRTKTVRRTNAKRIVVEHTFAWLHQYRRLLLFYEQTPPAYVSFVLLALGHLISKRIERAGDRLGWMSP